MKNWLKLCLLFGIVIGYVIIINIVANFVSFSNGKSQDTETIIGGNIVKIGISHSVSVQVTRNRWYGEIIINNGIEYLYLFNLIGLPKKINNCNFVIFHLIFLVMLTLFTILIFTKRKIYKEENLNLEHKKLVEDTNNYY